MIFIVFALVYCSRTFFYVLGITSGHPDTIDDKQRGQNRAAAFPLISFFVHFHQHTQTGTQILAVF